MLESRFSTLFLLVTSVFAFGFGFAVAILTSTREVRFSHTKGREARPQTERSATKKGTDETPNSKSPVPVDTDEIASIEDFLDLLEDGRAVKFGALTHIEKNWHPGHRAMLLETLRFVRSQSMSEAMRDVLNRKTGSDHGRDRNAWFREIWSEPYAPHPDYVKFKSELYKRIDPRFSEYFDNDTATIRLDEIRWGGVRRDGIPPLENPKTVGASEADYLAETDLVFGIQIGGEARAYPKRILAWHEMVKDIVGGQSICGVYCTLCGSMIVYRTETESGTHHELGTSGFLYRSNKLMYDHATKSLWSTIAGEPVVGELVGQGIKLLPHYVVTTTWGKWKEAHPETRVLSLKTGHQRDYDEGAAYRDYFATDRLMFEVPKLDKRLKNKDEVFIVRAENEPEPLAISQRFLQSHLVYHDTVGRVAFVVITDSTGAHRAYESPDQKFVGRTDSTTLLDDQQRTWKITEQEIFSADGETKLKRLPAHRAFWFGWHAAHPDTRLVK